MKQLTKNQAIKIYDSEIYKDMTSEQIVKFQLFQSRLCVPFSVFHKAITEVLGRPVWTHEFAFKDNLMKEYLGKKSPPTMEEIINLIPEEKRIIIGFNPNTQ
ncbi:hypothetical protein ES705_19835 [subsurface metagenome]